MDSKNERPSTGADPLQRYREEREEERRREGARRLSELAAKGRESHTKYGRELFAQWGDAYRKSLELAAAGWAMNPLQAGPHYAAMPLLLHFAATGLAPVAATVLNAVIAGISRRRRFEAIASTIGRAVEQEARATAMHSKANAAARLIQKKEGGAGLTRAQTLTDFQLNGEWWERKDRFELGALLLDLLLAERERPLLSLEASGDSRWVLPSPEALAVIAEHKALELASAPSCPMPRSCPSAVIHGKDLHRHVRRRDGGGLGYLEGRDLSFQAQALNIANQTKLRLDRLMVETVAWAWESGVDVFPCPPRATDATAGLARNRWAAEREQRASVRGQLKVDDAIRAMKQAAQADWFHLEHCLDFRGRMYTCSGPVSYQGPDYVKGCLAFPRIAEPFTFNERLALESAAGHWGHGFQRATWADREGWARRNTDLIRSVAQDPRACREWTEAESPFQFLQACRALSGWWEERSFDSPTLPIRYDQTCSGVGHVAALVGDPKLLRLTNMTGESRWDLYEYLAIAVQDALKVDLQMNPLRCRAAGLWLEIGINRSLLKTPVISAVYGAAHFSILDYLAEHLLTKVELRHPSDYQRLVTNPASYLARIILDVMKHEMGSVFELQKWMTEVVSTVTSRGKEVEWTSPSGMPVRLWSHRAAVAPIRTHLSGDQGWWTDDSELRGREFSSRASGPGATANLIHSFDAALVHRVLQQNPGENSLPVLCTHDCFAVPCNGSHRATLASRLRDGIKELYIPAALDEFGWLGVIRERIRHNAGLPRDFFAHRLPEPPRATINSGDSAFLGIGENPYLFS